MHRRQRCRATASWCCTAPLLPPPPQGIHKILKKHDKMVPHAPCRQFYVAHVHQQPWVQGNYSDVLVRAPPPHCRAGAGLARTCMLHPSARTPS
jgi:hypothetical protein